MGCPDSLLRGIYNHGFSVPSEIQKRAIVPLKSGKDIIAQAQSGTGKTGAFSIGLLSRIDFTKPQPQVIVLSPTRDLALQTEEVVSKIGQFMTPDGRLTGLFCGGGASVQEHATKIKSGSVFVVVGTPGRVLDLLKRKALLGQHITTLVLDEADEMLSIGFADQIAEIFRLCPKQMQVALFSATFTPEVREMTTKFMSQPVEILMQPDQLTLEGIKQFYVATNPSDGATIDDIKYQVLSDLYRDVSVTQSVVFCSTRDRVNQLYEKLTAAGFPVSFMHADMSKEDREGAMRRFKEGHTRVLITTDVMSRGIDVQQVSFVINYDITSDKQKECYLHRIGRSGRYGRRGIAINFVSDAEMANIKNLQDHYRTTIDELPEDFKTYLN